MNLIRNRKKSVLELQNVFPANLHKNDVLFVCIGSDLSIGDSLGPLVGTELERCGFHVIGTMNNPLHGANLKQRIREEMLNYEQKMIIAVDACLGTKSEVGKFEVRKGPIHPGAGLGKNLIKVGDYSIAAIVSSAGPFDFLNNTKMIRLSFVMDMASQIVNEINDYFGISKAQLSKHS